MVVLGVTAVSVPLLHDGRTPVPPAHHPKHATVFDAPALQASIIAPTVDPAKDLALPRGVMGLPSTLTPSHAVDTPPGRAVMVTKERRGDQRVLYALDLSLRWHRLRVDAPADIGNGLGPMLDPTSLSPDGSGVALRGADHVYVVDLATGHTTSVRSGGDTRIAWKGSRTLRLSTDPTLTYDDRVEVRVVDRGHGATAYQESDGGHLVAQARRTAAASYDVARLLAGEHQLAMTASPTFAGQRAPGPGLLVLDRPGYRGRAFLPVRHADQGTQGEPLARGWLTPDVLLFSVQPASVHGSTVDFPREDYLTWNLRTGAVRRESSVDQYWRDSSWATALLTDPGAS
jgi:hypothetical protein